MSFLYAIFDFLTHFDRHLSLIIQNYGSWTYLFLFLIIFSETGFVVTPFLPGDSLLFVVGAFSSIGALDVSRAFILLFAAAVCGDNLNYAIGRAIGKKVFKYENSRFFKKEYLTRTHEFYQRHGTKTIILARFVPIVRTFAPFVAGVGSMYYPKFLLFDIFGGLFWVGTFVFAGYWFGNISFVKNNFTLVTYLIVFVSVLPIIIKCLKKSKTPADGQVVADPGR
jgi:membrane-associated protein